MDVPRWTTTYTTRTLQQLETLRNDCKWTDVVLQTTTGTEKFPAHRCVLASASPYFGAMLGSGKFAEAGKEVITIGDLTDDGLKLLLDFIYSGNITLTSDKISDVLRAATLTQVQELVDFCEQVLRERMNPDNVVDIWTHSQHFALGSLQSSVLELVGKTLIKIDRKVLLRFDGEFMKRLLKEAVIPLAEQHVLAVAVQWLDFNWKCREKYAKALLRCIYWDRIHLSDQRAISSRCSKGLRSIFTEISKSASPSVPRGMVASVVILGGFSIDGPINSIRTLQVEQRKQKRNNTTTTKVTARTSWVLPHRVRTVDFAVCALPDGGLLICGGTALDEDGRETVTPATLVLDVQANRWVLAGTMKKPRTGCVAIWHRNFVYVFGGDEDGQATCERYNIFSNHWEYRGTAYCSNDGSAICTLGSKIIISGGTNTLDLPTTGHHSYDPENNSWTQLPELPLSFSDHSMFTFNRKVYVLGGWTLEEENSVHKLHTDVFSYSPTAGWQKELWNINEPKPFQRCVLAEKRVYLVGGGCLKPSQRWLGTSNSPTKSSEKSDWKWYDLVSQQWNDMEVQGTESAFWDHQAIMAFLPGYHPEKPG